MKTMQVTITRETNDRNPSEYVFMSRDADGVWHTKGAFVAGMKHGEIARYLYHECEIARVENAEHPFDLNGLVVVHLWDCTDEIIAAHSKPEATTSEPE